MKKPTIETADQGWSRFLDFRRTHKTRWQSQADCPLRIVGVTEMDFANISPRLLKDVDTALKRGYALKRNSQLTPILELVRKYNPIKNVPIGYLGKTEFYLYVPTYEQACELRDHIIALNSMTDSFTARNLKAVEESARHNMYAYVSCYWAWNRQARRDDHNPQLRPCFTKVRPMMDEAMEADAFTREEIARWVESKPVLRIPFDSHKERKK